MVFNIAMHLKKRIFKYYPWIATGPTPYSNQGDPEHYLKSQYMIAHRYLTNFNQPQEVSLGLPVREGTPDVE